MINRARADDDSATPARPQLWCPGLVFVTPAGEVQLGPSVGYSSHDPAFKRLRCGRQSKLSYWTHAAWLVARAALSDDIIAEHAIVLPETLVDQRAQPHAHRWLREQPLVCVSGVTWPRLVADGVPAFRVAFDATANRVLDIEGGGRDGPALAVSLDVVGDPTHAADDRQLLDRHGDPSAIDRALRVLSHGVLDEMSVLNAFDARSLIEDGYGYRGALEGRFNEMDALACEMRMLDVMFGQIFDRAAAMRANAEHLCHALSHAPADAGEVSVPLYGRAQRVIVPELHIPCVDRTLEPAQGVHTVELPSEPRWTVANVHTWSPRAPSHLALVPAPHLVM